MAVEPSPEVRQIMRDWVKKQQEKYGPNWKKILADEMAKEAEPFMSALLKLQKKDK